MSKAAKSISVCPTTDPEERENVCIALSMDLAEQRLRDGTASNQIITHFLKRGSMKEQIEMENLRKQNELLVAKVESLNRMSNLEDLYSGAINALTSYRTTDES